LSDYSSRSCDGEKTTAQIAAEAAMQWDAAEFAENLSEIIKSTMAAQCILNEMARRQGKHVPPPPSSRGIQLARDAPLLGSVQIAPFFFPHVV
jgi:hypothetical protein